ncbi:hypothetical protein KZ779_09575 [Escherichia coli]|nr:hypothetical protein [Escherichia coli]
MKAVFCVYRRSVIFNPFSSLAGDYTEVFEEKNGAFYLRQQEEVFY